jgi:hypothetical protein
LATVEPHRALTGCTQHRDSSRCQRVHFSCMQLHGQWHRACKTIDRCWAHATDVSHTSEAERCCVEPSRTRKSCQVPTSAATLDGHDQADDSGTSDLADLRTRKPDVTSAHAASFLHDRPEGFQLCSNSPASQKTKRETKRTICRGSANIVGTNKPRRLVPGVSLTGVSTNQVHVRGR